MKKNITIILLIIFIFGNFIQNTNAFSFFNTEKSEAEIKQEKYLELLHFFVPKNNLLYKLDVSNKNRKKKTLLKEMCSKFTTKSKYKYKIKTPKKCFKKYKDNINTNIEGYIINIGLDEKEYNEYLELFSSYSYLLKKIIQDKSKCEINFINNKKISSCDSIKKYIYFIKKYKKEYNLKGLGLKNDNSGLFRFLQGFYRLDKDNYQDIYSLKALLDFDIDLKRKEYLLNEIKLKKEKESKTLISLLSSVFKKSQDYKKILDGLNDINKNSIIPYFPDNSKIKYVYIFKSNKSLTDSFLQKKLNLEKGKEYSNLDALSFKLALSKKFAISENLENILFNENLFIVTIIQTPNNKYHTVLLNITID